MDDIINTPRLLLRRFAAGDADALYGYLADEQVVRYEPYGVPTRAQCEAEALRRAEDPGFWAVCRAGDGQLMGNVTLMAAGQEGWELGYVFGTAYQGMGYATEAARAVVGHAFIEKRAHRVAAMCNPENTASWLLLERLGMRREGHLLKNVWFGKDDTGLPLWQDTYLYALLREEWEEAGTGSP